jgi:hypothetical protein
MPIPLLAPLVVTAATAAAAGWIGARWWGRVFGSPDRLAGTADGGAQQPAQRRAAARTMAWCGECGRYVLPERARECAEPRCRLRR